MKGVDTQPCSHKQMDPSLIPPHVSIDSRCFQHWHKDEFVRFAKAAVIEACSFFTAEQSAWPVIGDKIVMELESSPRSSTRQGWSGSCARPARHSNHGQSGQPGTLPSGRPSQQRCWRQKMNILLSFLSFRKVLSHPFRMILLICQCFRQCFCFYAVCFLTTLSSWFQVMQTNFNKPNDGLSLEISGLQLREVSGALRWSCKIVTKPG